MNNPNAALVVGDKMGYNNDGEVGWLGFFGQLEYGTENFDAFVSSSLQKTSYQRIEYFLYDLSTEAGKDLATSEKIKLDGYSIKGGANYRLDDVQNVFANIGYFERPAAFNAVFNGYNNTKINRDAENEKVFSLELGYGVRAEKFAANVNVYRTQWNDRTFTRSVRATEPGAEDYTANLLGVNALHQGVEFDFTYKPSNNLNFSGMVSLGDWKWDNNLEDVPVFNENQEEVTTLSLPIKGLRVSNAAQTTAALGMLYKFWDRTSITVDYNYFANLYARIDVLNYANATETPTDSYKVPSYGTVDASLRHSFNFGTFDTTLTARINNLLDTEYIADAIDASDPLVFFGFGRTFSLSAKIKF